MSKTYKFLILTGGIFVFFFLFGVIQENITKAKYPISEESTENFLYSTSLVFIYCSVNYLLALILSNFLKEEDSTPTFHCCILALVYCLAMLCSVLALQFVSYPTQVVAKSCKPIPVMIFGVLLGKRTYSFKKYVFIGLVVVGVIMFMYKDKSANEVEKGFGIGEVLVLSSLFMDGIIAAGQERMKIDFHTKPLAMMIHLNKWATVYLGALLLFTKEIFKFLSFLQRHPSVLWKLGALSICGFVGQFSMIMTVTEFGTLPASTVATVRKFFTVLASVLLLGNSLLPRQWVATVIIFTGLLLDVIYGKTVTKVK